MIKNICIIPHYGIKGGSGKYTKQFSEILTSRYNVFFFGKYSEDFSSNIFIEINLFWGLFFKKNIIPNYEGIKNINKITFTFFSILYSILWIFKKTDYSPIIFILTSSIQAPLIALLKKKFKNCKVIILIQENFIIDNSFVSRITTSQIKKANLIYSIDKIWADKAETIGIKSYIFTNKFPRNYPIEHNIINIYDFLYVGGDQKIKGFNNLIKILDELNMLKISFKICILGQVSDSNKMYINSKQYNYLKLEMPGFVDNIFNYISKSNFLFFPIESPHFLRPAIEAGMLNKTFIIKKFNSIESFAIDNYNCIMYDTIHDATKSIITLSRDKNYCSKLAYNNFIISKKYQLCNFNEESFFENFNVIFD